MKGWQGKQNETRDVSMEVLIWLGGTLSLGSVFWKDAELQGEWCASSAEAAREGRIRQ